MGATQTDEHKEGRMTGRQRFGLSLIPTETSLFGRTNTIIGCIIT